MSPFIVSFKNYLEKPDIECGTHRGMTWKSLRDILTVHFRQFGEDEEIVGFVVDNNGITARFMSDNQKSQAAREHREKEVGQVDRTRIL